SPRARRYQCSPASRCAVAPVPGTFPCPVTVTLAPDVADSACPTFCARLVRGVTNGPSPDWLQRRLRAIGLRPISVLVDITNYLTFDRARPLHVFDAARVTGGLTVRLSRPGETLTGLDDKDYAFDDAMTVIADETAVESIGGVMGGRATGCTEATTDVLIEAAFFDPVRTAATGRKLKINSDARYRFERGVDPASARDGIEMATRLVLDLCGGEPSEVLETGAVPDWQRAHALDPARVVSLVGLDIAEAEQVRI
ncbi:MAG: phenylalanine--tRNA ligase beta subunit-related protein, partial [Pseudomonadota bacterium]